MVLGAKRCWETGLLFFPDNTVMRNELGNLLVQLGDFGRALEEYDAARKFGMKIAELNMAIVLELEGRTAESVARYENTLQAMKAAGLPHRHISIKMATVLPRVLPSVAELGRLRHRVNARLDEVSHSLTSLNHSVTQSLSGSLSY